jgi:hypothetical protein
VPYRPFDLFENPTPHTRAGQWQRRSAGSSQMRRYASTAARQAGRVSSRGRDSAIAPGSFVVDRGLAELRQEATTRIGTLPQSSPVSPAWRPLSADVKRAELAGPHVIPFVLPPPEQRDRAAPSPVPRSSCGPACFPKKAPAPPIPFPGPSRPEEAMGRGPSSEEGTSYAGARGLS